MQRKEGVAIPVQVRPAVADDLPQVAALAARLVRMHHAVDRDRFFLPDDVAGGYAWWLGRELARKKAVVLVAERPGKGRAKARIVGYSYGTREDKDWNLLLDQHGAIHDVFVDSRARGKGVGRALLTAMKARLEELGALRIVLSTMVSNVQAQRLFRAAGFRPTMLEMTYSA